ncbi:hypothetical protein CPC08DRAFT_385521 [Agrocybe pediades]|nr:hypothetical protein CPC08DRAFT_385521 [Agrocybe pediades]
MSAMDVEDHRGDEDMKSLANSHMHSMDVDVHQESDGVVSGVISHKDLANFIFEYQELDDTGLASAAYSPIDPNEPEELRNAHQALQNATAQLQHALAYANYVNQANNSINSLYGLYNMNFILDRSYVLRRSAEIMASIVSRWTEEKHQSAARLEVTKLKNLSTTAEGNSLPQGDSKEDDGTAAPAAIPDKEMAGPGEDADDESGLGSGGRRRRGQAEPLMNAYSAGSDEVKLQLQEKAETLLRAYLAAPSNNQRTIALKRFDLNIRRALREAREFLPGIATISRELVLWLHARRGGYTKCRWCGEHRADSFDRHDTVIEYFGSAFERKPAKNREGKLPTREPGHLHCGCSEEDVLFEFFFWKTWKVFSSNNTIHGVFYFTDRDFLDPRTRGFVVANFKAATGLQLDDIYDMKNDFESAEYNKRIAALKAKAALRQLQHYGEGASLVGYLIRLSEAGIMPEKAQPVATNLIQNVIELRGLGVETSLVNIVEEFCERQDL